jgi:hypothetical protein
MIVSQPLWGRKSRFFLPNEDAHVVREALTLLKEPPRFPVFVGGSGLLLLEAVRALPGGSKSVYVDISRFQVEYFGEFLKALDRCDSPGQLREWFSAEVYPVLRDHFVKVQDRFYREDQVLGAMEKLFRIRFFFENEAFAKAKAAGELVEIFHEDIQDYLEETHHQHDFVYLSNVLDYLPLEKVSSLFRSCKASRSAVYALITEVCADQEAVARIWEGVGYEVHPRSAGLSTINQGLGSRSLERPWNRKGEVLLLTPGRG